MKIQTLSEDELEIKSSGVASLVIGIVMVPAGIAIGATPLFTTAEWWVSLIGLAVAGIGALIAFSASSTRNVLRRSGASTITEKRLIGGKTKEASFDASQIVQVRLETHSEYTADTSSESGSRSSQGRRQRVSSLLVVLKDATEITIASERESGGVSMNGISLNSVSSAPLSKEAQQVADFLGVPLVTGLQDVSLQNIVGAVQGAFKQSTQTVETQSSQEQPAAPAEDPQQSPVVPGVPRQ